MLQVGLFVVVLGSAAYLLLEVINHGQGRRTVSWKIMHFFSLQKSNFAVATITSVVATLNTVVVPMIQQVVVGETKWPAVAVLGVWVLFFTLCPAALHRWRARQATTRSIDRSLAVRAFFLVGIWSLHLSAGFASCATPDGRSVILAVVGLFTFQYRSEFLFLGVIFVTNVPVELDLCFPAGEASKKLLLFGSLQSFVSSLPLLSAVLGMVQKYSQEQDRVRQKKEKAEQRAAALGREVTSEDEESTPTSTSRSLSQSRQFETYIYEECEGDDLQVYSRGDDDEEHAPLVNHTDYALTYYVGFWGRLVRRLDGQSGLPRLLDGPGRGCVVELGIPRGVTLSRHPEGDDTSAAYTLRVLPRGNAVVQWDIQQHRMYHPQSIPSPLFHPDTAYLTREGWVESPPSYSTTGQWSPFPSTIRVSLIEESSLTEVDFVVATVVRKLSVDPASELTYLGGRRFRSARFKDFLDEHRFEVVNAIGERFYVPAVRLRFEDFAVKLQGYAGVLDNDDGVTLGIAELKTLPGFGIQHGRPVMWVPSAPSVQ